MRYLFSLIFIVLLSACAKPQTLIRHSTDYARILHDNQSDIPVYPAKTHVISSDIVGTEERMYDYEYFIEDSLATLIKERLKEKGYTAKTIHKRDIKNQKLYQNTDRIQQNIDTEITRIYTPSDEEDFFNPKNAFSIHTNLGADTKELALKIDNDLIIFLSYSEIVKTSGAQTRDMLISLLVAGVSGQNYQSNEAEAATLRIVITDLNNSKILWTYAAKNSVSDVNSLYNSFSDDKELATEKLKALVNIVLSELPDRNKLLTPKEDKE